MATELETSAFFDQFMQANYDNGTTYRGVDDSVREVYSELAKYVPLHILDENLSRIIRLTRDEYE